MSQNIGVEMTILRPADREILMQGMILRRIRESVALSRAQLDVAIEQDVIAIQSKFGQFNFERYVGVDLDTFYKAMMELGLLAERQHEDVTLYERGQTAGAFDAELSDDMDWLLDMLPMSTRGLFDKLKQNPEREVVMSADDFMDKVIGDAQRVVEDHRNKKTKISDNQLKA